MYIHTYILYIYIHIHTHTKPCLCLSLCRRPRVRRDTLCLSLCRRPRVRRDALCLILCRRPRRTYNAVRIGLRISGDLLCPPGTLCVCVCCCCCVLYMDIYSLRMCSLCLQVIQPLVLSMSDRSSWRAINRVVLYRVLFVECVLYTCRTTSASATSTKVGRSAGRSAHVRCNSAHSASGHSPGRVSRSPPQTRSATASVEAIKP